MAMLFVAFLTGQLNGSNREPIAENINEWIDRWIQGIAYRITPETAERIFDACAERFGKDGHLGGMLKSAGVGGDERRFSAYLSSRYLAYLSSRCKMWADTSPLPDKARHTDELCKALKRF
jgi:hypothetical protein